MNEKSYPLQNGTGIYDGASLRKDHKNMITINRMLRAFFVIATFRNSTDSA